MNQNRLFSAGDLLGFHPRQCDTDSDEHGQEHDHHPPYDRRTWSNGVGQGGHLDVGRRLCEHVGGLGIVGAFPRRRQLRGACGCVRSPTRGVPHVPWTGRRCSGRTEQARREVGDGRGEWAPVSGPPRPMRSEPRVAGKRVDCGGEVGFNVGPKPVDRKRGRHIAWRRACGECPFPERVDAPRAGRACAQGINIRARIHRGTIHRLFRGEIVERPENDVGPIPRIDATCLRREVGRCRDRESSPRPWRSTRRLAGLMSRWTSPAAAAAASPRDFDADRRRLGAGERAVPRHRRLEVDAIDVFHHQKGRS